MAVLLIYIVWMLTGGTSLTRGANLIGYEGQPSILVCPNPPVLGGSSLAIAWFKQSVTSLEDDDLLLANRIAIYSRVLDTIDGPIYEGDLVDRAELNPDTGTLTIFSTQILDEHMYVCFNTPGGKGAVNLGVYVKPSELFLDAPSSQIVENTTVTFTCTAERVRPEPTSMYFTFTDDEGTQLGVRNTVEVTGESGVFRDVVTLEYTAVYTDASRTLRCVLDLGVAGQVTEDCQLHITDRPRGRPILILSAELVAVGGMVEMTCATDQIDAGPAGITWYYFLRDNTFVANSSFGRIEINIRSALDTGNFSCLVGNQYASSHESREVLLRLSTEMAQGGGLTVGGILGVVGGLMTLSLLVVAAAFLIRHNRTHRSDKVGTLPPPDGHPEPASDDGEMPHTYATVDYSQVNMREDRRHTTDDDRHPHDDECAASVEDESGYMQPINKRTQPQQLTYVNDLSYDHHLYE